MSSVWIARTALVICIFGLLPSSLIADVLAASKGKQDLLSELQRDVAVIKETTELRLEAQKESLQKDLQNLQSKVEQQDKRIADINASTDRLSMVLTGFATLITLLAAGAGVAAWYSAGTKAREAAKEWIKDHESELIADARKATGKVEEESAKARELIQEQHKAFTASVEEYKRGLQERVTSLTVSASTPTPAQKEALDAQEDSLKRKPEIEYTFSDWELRALSAYAAKQFDLAANFFFEASQSHGATSLQVARALVLRAAMMGQMNRAEEAIEICENVIRRYGEAADPDLKVQVAMAMFNKGIAYSRLKRHEDALVAFEEVIKRYNEATARELRAQVAHAMINKGGSLARLNRREEAMVVYDQIIKRYGDGADLVAHEAVSAATNGLGFNDLLKGKSASLNGEPHEQLFAAAESKFRSALARYPKNSFAIGNLSYVMFLTGRRGEAIELLHQALELGGEDLYQATIKDTETFTVPEDAVFRELVEKAWRDIKFKKSK